MERKNNKIYILLIAAAILALLAGCSRERPTAKPPIHLNPNMDNQEKFLPQSQNKFFADSSAQRQPVAGTVPRGYLRNDDIYFRGMKSNGQPIDEIPVKVDIHLLQRGRQRFDIYCSPCHSRVGDGRGIMVERGYPPPPSFHSERLLNVPDGHIFDVITNGLRNMPSYRHQVPVADRWAIVAYLRALQLSQNATLQDVPEEQREKLREVK